MRTSLFAFAAALTLPLEAPALSQAPARIDLDTVTPLSGSWSYQSFAGGSRAVFADAAATQRLILRCNRASRTVSIVRTQVPAAAPALSVWTTSTARSLPARFEAAQTLTADVRATDPLLDAIAYSRGRFATGAAGLPMAAVPVWPEVSRVIEDCRS